MDVNYRKKRYYNTARYPLRQPRWVVGLIWLLSKIALMGKTYKIKKINTEGLKPPYILFSNHMYFVDFELNALATWPHRVNNVVSQDGYYLRPWLMELIGCIATRKFIADLHLVKSIRKVIQRGDILCMYPEARYSAIGTTAFLPESLGKLVKMNNCPLVVAVHRGNHLEPPFWCFSRPRKGVPLHLTLTQVLTAEQVQQMSADEINAALRQALEYDEYRYQKEAGFLISAPNRAEGLHKILYHCPHCRTESRMASQGTELFCTACGKRWNLEADGSLHVEYDYHRIVQKDAFEIAIETDSFYCFPEKPDVITKLALATEDLYKMEQARRKAPARKALASGE